MVERRRIIKAQKKSPCELCDDELGKEGAFYNRETKECDCKREEGYLLGKFGLLRFFRNFKFFEKNFFKTNFNFCKIVSLR